MKNKLGVFVAAACLTFIFTTQVAAQTGTALTRQAIEEYLAKGENDIALSALLEALVSKDFPDRDWAMKQYFSIADSRGELASAINNLAQKAQAYPDDDTLQLSLSEGYIRLRDWNKVTEIYEKLVQKNPNDPVLNNRLRNFYMLQGNYDGIIRSLQPQVQANPDDVGASDMLLNAYVKAGKAKEAIELFEKRIGKEPGSAALHGRYAQALMDFGRLSDAAREWQKAFELDPKNLFFKQKLAETYLALQNYTQAKKEYQDLEQLAPAKQPWFRNAASGQLQAIDDKVKGKKR